MTEQDKAERERRLFVSNVSHELRTPLTSVKAYLEALEDGAIEDKETASSFINVSLTETNRMIRMISDLLTLSRMDQDRIVLNKEMICSVISCKTAIIPEMKPDSRRKRANLMWSEMDSFPESCVSIVISGSFSNKS